MMLMKIDSIRDRIDNFLQSLSARHSQREFVKKPPLRDLMKGIHYPPTEKLEEYSITQVTARQQFARELRENHDQMVEFETREVRDRPTGKKKTAPKLPIQESGTKSQIDPETSGTYGEKINWRCEKCRTILRHRQKDLHVIALDGNPLNTDSQNLIGLCDYCVRDFV